MDMLLGGDPMRGLVITDGGWLLAILPPGAFFSLALAIAIKNSIDRRQSEKRQQAMPGRARRASQ
jgi:electron transport complex protein RnfE